MTTDRMDLDGYCARIGFTGPRTPTLDTLNAIHLLHPQAIPFENLDPLLGVPPDLEIGPLEDKLVRRHRGGYCFEHNLLLKHVLETIGFRVTGLGGRVVWGAAPGARPARSHMLLRIELPDGPYLADVGFGGLTLTTPLRFTPDIAQSTPHEPFRVASIPGGYRMEVKLGNEWQALYRFDLVEQELIDYQVANWYVATHPRSTFVNGLVAARVHGNHRLTLRNTTLSDYSLGGSTHRRTLTDVDELKGVLTGSFGITLPDHPGLDAVLTRILATSVPVADTSSARPELAAR